MIILVYYVYCSNLNSPDAVSSGAKPNYYFTFGPTPCSCFLFANTSLGYTVSEEIDMRVLAAHH